MTTPLKTSTTPCTFADRHRDLLRRSPQRRGVFAENTDLDRLRRADQIADQIGEDAGKFDAQRGSVDSILWRSWLRHVIGRRRIFQLDREVAGVRFRHAGEAELRSRPPRISIHLGHLFQHLLDVMQHPVGLVERRTGRRDVIENEAVLLELGQELGAETFVDEEREHGEHRDDDENERTPRQRVRKQPFVGIDELREERAVLFVRFVSRLRASRSRRALE